MAISSCSSEIVVNGVEIGGCVGVVDLLCLGRLSVEPSGLPRLARGAASAAEWSVIWMRAGVLVAGTCDLVTLAASANESGNCSIVFVRYRILCTSVSVRAVRGSFQNCDCVCQCNSVDFSGFCVLSCGKVSS